MDKYYIKNIKYYVFNVFISKSSCCCKHLIFLNKESIAAAKMEFINYEVPSECSRNSRYARAALLIIVPDCGSKSRSPSVMVISS